MIYFDNAATTKIGEKVLASYVEVSNAFFGNPSSLHHLGETASRLLSQSRKQIASLLEVENEEIIFTSGGTEGDNWAIKGTAFEKAHYGKHLITTTIEHPAVLRSFEQLENLGWDVTYLTVDDKGQVNPEDVEKAIRQDTVLVSIMAVNNETGSIQPLRKIGKVLEKYPSIHFHVDAVQTVGTIDFTLKNSRIDIAVFSGHKFHGPRGTGFVYLKKGKRLMPLINGGGQESGKRSGTENLPAIVALSKAYRLSLEKSQEKQHHLSNLKNNIINSIQSLEKMTLFSPKESAPHIICFGIKNIRGEVVVHALEKEGVFVSTTSACSSKRNQLSRSIVDMGFSQKEAETAVRISLSSTNTKEEVEQFKKIFSKVYAQLSNIS